jgi:hypothetical protein
MNVGERRPVTPPIAYTDTLEDCEELVAKRKFPVGSIDTESGNDPARLEPTLVSTPLEASI